MKLAIVHWPGQTSPDIYADHAKFPAGIGGEGIYPQWGIGLTISGCSRWSVRNEDFVLSVGDLHITRPHTRLAWRTDKPRRMQQEAKTAPDQGWELIYATFLPRPHWQPWLDALLNRSGTAQIHTQREQQGRMHAAFTQMLEVYDRGGPLRDDLTLFALENILLILLGSIVLEHNTQNRHVMDAVDIIHARYAEPLTVPDISRSVHLSVQQLSALFRTELGLPPAQYVERIRMNHASEKLRFSMASVAEIAQACGFADPAYFSRRFRHYFGETPSDYRKSKRSNTSGDAAIASETVQG